MVGDVAIGVDLCPVTGEKLLAGVLPDGGEGRVLQLAGATGARADVLRVTGHALIQLRQWTFLLGPGVMAGINGLFLAYVMYRSRLVPRIIPTVGLIGAPLILASSTATMFGLWDQVSRPAAVLALPVAAWEFSLGLWLTFKGFKPAAVTALGTPAATLTSAAT